MDKPRPTGGPGDAGPLKWIESIPRHVGPAAGAGLAGRVAAALAAVRVARGLSQEDAARELSAAVGRSVTQGYVSKVEHGRTRVSWERLEAFCACYDVTPGDVVGLADKLAAGAAETRTGGKR